MVREIPLSKGFVALVDDEDYERVSVFRWNAQTSVHTDTVYATRQVGEAGHRVNVFLHRFIMGAVSGEEVDHKNRNGLDCTRGNLRLTDHRKNTYNYKLSRNNTSGFHGVTYMRTGGKRVKRWRAEIKPDGKNVTIGYYLTAEEAARARDVVAIRYFGDFATLNFPVGEIDG